MPLYVVSSLGSDTGAGTVGAPMSVNRACGKVAGFTPAPGDIFEIRGGIYAQALNPVVSGTSSAPITYRFYGTEHAYFDGSRQATNIVTANPDPWVDVASETGWSLYGGSNAVVAAGSNIYSKTASAPRAIFCDAYQTGMGTSLVAGPYCSLWDMHLTNLYGANPALRIHDYDSSHDNFNINGQVNNSAGDPTLRAHGPEAQWATTGGAVYIRLFGPNWNPTSHKLYFGGGGNGLVLHNVDYIVIDGGNQQLHFWRWSTIVDMDNARHCRILNVDACFSWFGATGVFNHCDDTTFQGCRLYGAGSFTAHNVETFNSQAAVGQQLLSCDIGWGGHSNGQWRQVTGLTVRNCYFHDSGGHGIMIDKGGNSGHLWEQNLFVNSGRNSAAAGNYPTFTFCHRMGHIAFKVTALDNSTVRRNLFYNCGMGIGLTYVTGATTSGNRVYHNTIAQCENQAFHLESANAGGTTNNNICANNIVYNVGLDGKPLALGYDIWCEIMDAGATMGGNKMVYTDFYNTGRAVKFWVWAYGTPNLTQANGAASVVNSAYPDFFRISSADGYHNLNVDPSFNGSFPNEYRLNSGSPCRSVGTTAYTDSAIVGTPDMGYLEQENTPPPPIGSGGGGGTTNLPPTISSFSSNVVAGNAPLVVNFTVQATDDQTAVGSLVIAYNFGDVNSGSNTASGSGLTAAAHTYSNPGRYTATVTVTDGGSLTATASLVITIGSGVGGTLITGIPTNAYASAGGGTLATAGQTADKIADGRYLNSNPAGVLGDNSWSQSGLVTGPGAPQSVTENLQSDRTLTRVRTSFFRWELGRSATYTLETAPAAGTPWTAICTARASLTGTGNEWDEVAFAQRTLVRFLRWTISANSEGSNYATIWEREAYEVPSGGGGPGTKINVVLATDSLGRSSQNPSDFGPGNCFDQKHTLSGDPVAKWLVGPVDATHQQWVTLDFGSDQSVKTVRIYWDRMRAGRIVTYDILKAINSAPASFSAVLSNQSNGVTTFYQEHVFGASQSCRYLRILAKAVNQGTGVGIFEVECFT